MLRLDLAQLFLGAQVDGAEPLAVAPQLFEPLLGRRDVGQFRPRRDLGKRRDVLRLGFEHLADFMRDVGGAAVRGLQPLLGARLLGARFTRRLERSTRGLVGFGERGLRRSAPVGGRALRRFGGLDLGNQRAALLGDRGRRAFERAALRPCVRRSLAERRGLAGRAHLAAIPFGALGRDRGEAPGAQLGFARERLGFAARFRQRRALRRDLAARLRELMFQIGGRAELLDRLDGVVLCRNRLVAARRETNLGFRQRRKARGEAACLALRRRMGIARRIGLGLRLTPRIACFAFRRHRGSQFGFRSLGDAALCLRVSAGVAKLAIEIGEAVLRGEPARRRGRRIRGGRKAVPAPQVAIGRHQPLAGLELRNERWPERTIDHADLRQPARKLGRRLHVLRERLRARRKRRIAIGRGTRPADRRSRIDRCFEIVAQRRAERRLVTLVDREQVDGGRPQLLRLHVDQLGECLRLGFEPVHAPVRFALRPPRHVERLPRAGMRRFGAQRRGFSLIHRALRGLGRRRECDDIRRAILRLVEVGKLVLDLADLRLEAHQPHRVLAHRAFELIAPRDEIGKRAGQFAEGLFDRGKRCFGSAHARRNLCLALRHTRTILREAGLLAGKPLQRRLGIGLLALLARRYPRRAAPAGDRAPGCAR